MPHATHAILRSDPTARNKTPAQRLFDAALVGNLDRVTALLQQGVDANAVDAYGTTPLILKSILTGLECLASLLVDIVPARLPQCLKPISSRQRTLSMLRHVALIYVY